jgi:tetratricopeptide (TPR) repeat protein
MATPLQILIALVLGLLMLGSVTTAQDNGASAVIERYDNLALTREGPTIDRELAQRMFRRGNTYSQLERHEEAIEEYRKAISADPNFVDAIRNLANTYYYLERYQEAKPLLARFIELQTATSAPLIAAVQTLGQLERDDGNFAEALEYDLQAIALDPNNDSQVHIMANTYNNNGLAEAAIEIYRAAIETMPDNAFFDRSLGRILERAGRLEEALDAYRRAAEKDPDSDFYADLVANLESRLAQ